MKFFNKNQKYFVNYFVGFCLIFTNLFNNCASDEQKINNNISSTLNTTIKIDNDRNNNLGTNSTKISNTNSNPAIIVKNDNPPNDNSNPNNNTRIVQLIPTTTLDSFDNCPELDGNMDGLTQEHFISKLTDACRYDKLVKPNTDQPLPVYIHVDLGHIESADQMKFTAHMRVQYRYRDNRLKYEQISPNRGVILGEEMLRNKIWVPHIIIKNEKGTMIMGIDGKDVFVSISPQGDVVYYYRMIATYYCWMNLKKFPFDSQYCDLRWTSWTYNISNLVLHWDTTNPVKVAENLHLTEFVLSDSWAQETAVTNGFTAGVSIGSYSELIFKFELSREVGYYIMDYFVPSILLVCTSWVTFWLQADSSPARTCLGTSTMLTFITLNSGLSRNLPKVSYIKASEVWFLACVLFIFCSLAEFAFVNVIWRRKKKVELKKPNSRYILKGAITPSVARKQLRKAESNSNLSKAESSPNLSQENGISKNKLSYNNYLTIHSFTSALKSPTTTTKTQSQDELVDEDMDMDDVVVEVPTTNEEKFEQQRNNETTTRLTMTPQEVAIWIDRKSRIVFPVSFLIFNIFYWTFVYIL